MDYKLSKCIICFLAYGEAIIFIAMLILNVYTVIKFKTTENKKLNINFYTLLPIVFLALCFFPLVLTVSLDNSFIYDIQFITINWIVIVCLVSLGLLNTFHYLHIYENYIITNFNKKISSDLVTYRINKRMLALFIENKCIAELFIPKKKTDEVKQFMQKYYKEKIPDNIENQN